MTLPKSRLKVVTSGILTGLIFEAGRQRYGLDVEDILEVVPAVRLRTLPGLPNYVAGIFSYRGELVPVLDLSMMLSGVAVTEHFSTRIVLVRYSIDGKDPQTLGLLVERASQGLVENRGELLSSGIVSPQAPYLGKFAAEGNSIVQFINVHQLIPENLRGLLFVEQ
jgi:chemotaxis-related protein WspB